MDFDVLLLADLRAVCSRVASETHKVFPHLAAHRTMFRRHPLDSQSSPVSQHQLLSVYHPPSQITHHASFYPFLNLVVDDQDRSINPPTLAIVRRAITSAVSKTMITKRIFQPITASISSTFRPSPQALDSPAHHVSLQSSNRGCRVISVSWQSARIFGCCRGL